MKFDNHRSVEKLASLDSKAAIIFCVETDEEIKMDLKFRTDNYSIFCKICFV